MKGLEPPRLSAPDPKSGTATNYATSAFFFGLYLSFLERVANVVIILLFSNKKFVHF